jgi:hypothetical protein
MKRIPHHKAWGNGREWREEMALHKNVLHYLYLPLRSFKIIVASTLSIFSYRMTGCGNFDSAVYVLDENRNSHLSLGSPSAERSIHEEWGTEQ